MLSLAARHPQISETQFDQRNNVHASFHLTSVMNLYHGLHVSISNMRALATIALLLLTLLGAQPRVAFDTPGARIISYDAARYSNIRCIAGRIIAETDPALDASARAQLWADYQLECTFEWVEEGSGFTYHELEVQPHSWREVLAALAGTRNLQPRQLNELVPLLDADPRTHWAAPDALLWEWAQAPVLPPGEELLPEVMGGYGASFVASDYSAILRSVGEWAAAEDRMAPWPDFEYYRLCGPEGSVVDWADLLLENDTFRNECAVAYGTGQQAALAAYRAAGNPPLRQTTMVVADTGMYLNHPDFAGLLHPNSIDAEYRSYEIARTDERAGEQAEIRERTGRSAIGLPRGAVQGRPAAHGTQVAGLAARCTDGFTMSGGNNAVRLLPASVKSETEVAFNTWKVKSPISAFIKLVRCLNKEFPTGANMPPHPDSGIINNGDVRVVSLSGSVPKSYFSDAEWRIVANIAGKAAGSIAEDLRRNDRVYVFAAGNDAQPEPSRPGEMEYVIAVTATMPFDGSEAWDFPTSEEGANLGQKCVAAPGWGLITSTIYPAPNLEYLPDEEFREALDNYAIPPREMTWREQTNHFGATSGATPQVAALAALLYAQQPSRTYSEVIGLVESSTGQRTVTAPWGEARGLIDYGQALGW